MIRGKKGGGIIVLVIFAVAVGLAAEERYQVVDGPENFYYGHISYVDPDGAGAETVVLREGRPRGLAAVLNTPIAPGDIIRTSPGRRLEIQFDSGTIVRLDFDSELKIETVGARSLSANKDITNLVLNRGRMYIMYKAYGEKELFQVLTPRTAVKLKHSTVAVISAGSDGPAETQVETGRADVLFGSDPQATGAKPVSKGNRLIVEKNNAARFLPAFEGGAFSLWNEKLNERFLALHEGQTAIPKPIKKYPAAVQYFAERYSQLHGEWHWDGMLGYVWRPFTNDIGIPGYSGLKYSVEGWDPGRGWQPYVHGQWTVADGRMFWVPSEPWGWVPYHLGLWHWNKKLGWVWIPGSAFSPAWVDWNFFFGSKGFVGMGVIWLNCYSPISIYEWMAAGNVLTYLPNVDLDWLANYFNRHPRMTTASVGYDMTRDGRVYQKTNTLTPIPSNIIKKVAAAVKNHEARVREELESPALRSVILAGNGSTSQPSGPVVLPPEDLEKFARLARLEMVGGGPVASLRISPKPPNALAVTPLRSAQAEQPESGQVQSGGNPSVERPVAGRDAVDLKNSPSRFHDWNPDLKIARSLGLRIEYLSGKNEIYCPEMNLSSSQRTDRLGSSRLDLATVAEHSAQAANGPVSSSGSANASASPTSRSSTAGRGDNRGSERTTEKKTTSETVKK